MDRPWIVDRPWMELCTALHAPKPRDIRFVPLCHPSIKPQPCPSLNLLQLLCFPILLGVVGSLLSIPNSSVQRTLQTPTRISTRCRFGGSDDFSLRRHNSWQIHINIWLFWVGFVVGVPFSRRSLVAGCVVAKGSCRVQPSLKTCMLNVCIVDLAPDRSSLSSS